ncbi:MAG: hypothetical protein JRH14_14050 [Deltaproteobacteria bacterium]|nr:hypothetical protein [Deltaproteobacteria bacterium]
MTLVALIICLFIGALGALGIVSPARLLRVARRAQTLRGLYFLAGLRMVLGIALVFSAPTSRAPGLILICGVIAILKGIITPFIGVERARKYLDRWSAQGSWFLRGWAVLILALGLLFTYAIAP